jgi:signal transduction histidine kinase/ActR/RegA family two-component response regulator
VYFKEGQRMSSKQEADKVARNPFTADAEAITMEAILNALPAHVAVLDSAGNILAVNDSWRQFALARGMTWKDFGVGADYLLACAAAHQWEAEEAQIAARGIHAVLAGETERFALEYLCRCPDRHCWYQMLVTPLTGRECRGALVMHMDITANRHLQEQVRHAQKMEAIGKLAGGIAHDFNNLLHVIIGFTELATESLTPDDPLLGYLRGIEHAAERAADLTRQLLAFGRRQFLEPMVVDLNNLVLNMVRLLRRILGEDIEIATILGADLWPVKVDGGCFEQVIANLALSSRDAMPEGGTLTLETENLILDENHVQQGIDIVPGPYVMLAIRDTGTGIRQEVTPRLFEPLHTTKDVGEGIGFSLATCCSIVRQSGGFIRGYNLPDRGARVEIYLPAVKEVQVKTPQTTDLTDRRGHETILLVEDERLVRQMAAQALRADGYTVLDADTGGEALVIAHEHVGEIHLLVTDIVMPHMSGRQLADRMRNVRPDIKVLYVSGYMDESVLRHGTLEEGAAFLAKPFTPSTLARKVRELLDALDAQRGL